MARTIIPAELVNGAVSSIAKLKALLPSGLVDGQVVNVANYYELAAVAAGGGGGPVEWLSTSTATADNGLYFAPDAGGTGRWRRTDPFLTPAQWGFTAPDVTSMVVGRTKFNSANTGTANTAFGDQSQLSTTVGPGGTGANTSYGYRSLSSNTVGQFSTAIGANNQYFADGLGYNSTFGYGAGYNLTTGTSNVAGGFEALHNCQAGVGNAVWGYSAQYYGLANGGVADTSYVVAIGTNAAQFNRANQIVAVGYQALKNNQGSGNVALGDAAGQENTTGSQSVLIGSSAGLNKTVGTYDVMIGFQAGLTQTTSAGFNVYVGGLAGYYNTTATQNVFVGYQAGQGTSGQNGSGGNVAVGNQAMGLCGNVGACVAVGVIALRSVTGAGSNNTGVGHSAGTTITTGADNTLLGSAADVTSATSTNRTVIGKGASGTADNTVTLGNTSVTGWYMGTTKLVGVRDTGYAAMTGTADEGTAYDTATITLPQLAGRVMALQASLTTHGLIGA